MLKLLFIIAFVVVCFAKPMLAQDNIVFPANAGVTNVRDLGAKGDGVADDTVAIQTALGRTGIIYLPNGTYRVSNTLKWGGKQTRRILQGQSQTGTIIKLIDNAPGYTNSAAPKEVIWTGVKPAQRFRNAIRNLTVDTGFGNIGAIGVKFIANNQGGMFNVTIRSGDGLGITGLDLGYTDEQGPCLIKNVRVIGYNTGIRTKYGVNSIVLEHITLEGQRRYGFDNDGQILSIRNLTSVNTVPAFYNRAGSGLVTLIDSNLAGGAVANNAIVNQAAMLVRNLITSGYGKAVDNSGGNGNDAQGPNVAEFVSHGVLSLFPSPTRTLNLSIQETPEIAWSAVDDWANIEDYGSRQIQITDSNGNMKIITDWTAAVQQAIDSGKSTVYFPGKGYNITGTVYLRGNVRRLIGMDRDWESGRSYPITFVVEDGTAPVVQIERFDWNYCKVKIVHESARKLLVSSILNVEVETVAGAGDVFIEDAVAKLNINSSNVWVRQLNSEGNPSDALPYKVVNNSGTLWILGLKTEGDLTQIIARNGAKTEVLGGFIYANSGRLKQPAFINDESSLSVTIGEFVIRNAPFLNLVVETRDGVTRTLKGATVDGSPVYGRGGGSMLPLYLGYKGTNEIIIDNNDSNNFITTGTWTASTELPGYFGSNYLHDGGSGANTVDTAKWLSPIIATATYDVYLRWTTANGAQRPDAVPVEVNYNGGVANLTVNQRLNNGQWVKIGRWSFTGGSGDYVMLKASDAGYTIADAVRFVKVP